MVIEAKRVYNCSEKKGSDSEDLTHTKVDALPVHPNMTHSKRRVYKSLFKLKERLFNCRLYGGVQKEF